MVQITAKHYKSIFHGRRADPYLLQYSLLVARPIVVFVEIALFRDKLGIFTVFVVIEALLFLPEDDSLGGQTQENKDT